MAWIKKKKESKQKVMSVWECHKSKPRCGLVSTSKRRLRIEAQICFLPRTEKISINSDAPISLEDAKKRITGEKKNQTCLVIGHLALPKWP